MKRAWESAEIERHINQIYRAHNKAIDKAGLTRKKARITDQQITLLDCIMNVLSDGNGAALFRDMSSAAKRQLASLLHSGRAQIALPQQVVDLICPKRRTKDGAVDDEPS
ncbi:MAG: hypothetical protein WCG83_04710 [Candidatus Peregrinibacteria bacterium]